MRSRRTRWVRAAIASAMIIVAMLNIAGCAGDPDDISAVSMPRAEVWRIMQENLNAVDPKVEVTPYPTNPNLVHRFGCATNAESWMPDGPPWRYRETEDYVGLTSRESDRLISAVRSLAQRGFGIRENIERRDPRDVSATDSRGFSVSVYFEESPNRPSRMEIVSASPCVRHPDPAENTL